MKTKTFSAESIAEILRKDTLLPVVLCIGTDRVTGDSLGPIVGELLTGIENAPFFVYGTLSSPVTALTLDAALAFIRRRHAGQTLIAIDSSLGNPEDVGKIRLLQGGIKPGLATGKRLPITGDISITATVAPLGESSSLGTVRLGFVWKLAYEITRTLSKGVDIFERSKPTTIPPVARNHVNALKSVSAGKAT